MVLRRGSDAGEGQSLPPPPAGRAASSRGVHSTGWLLLGCGAAVSRGGLHGRTPTAHSYPSARQALSRPIFLRLLSFTTVYQRSVSSLSFLFLFGGGCVRSAVTRMPCTIRTRLVIKACTYERHHAVARPSRVKRRDTRRRVRAARGAPRPPISRGSVALCQHNVRGGDGRFMPKKSDASIRNRW